jgi:hypothetical protein
LKELQEIAQHEAHPVVGWLGLLDRICDSQHYSEQLLPTTSTPLLQLSPNTCKTRALTGLILIWNTREPPILWLVVNLLAKTTDGLHYLKFLIVMKEDLGKDKSVSRSTSVLLVP